MKINFIRLENFRNVEFADVQLDAQNVWIHGQNAQGKTNLLEATGLLYALRSFRTSEMSAMVRYGEKSARVLAGISHETLGDCEVMVSIGDKRQAYIGDEEIKFSDFIGTFPALAMSNADISLLRGSPEIRRKDSDMFISSIDSDYFSALKIYHGALAQRNALLRIGSQNVDEYLPFETQMAESASVILSKRREKLGELGELASKKYAILAKENGENAEIKIKPNCDVQTTDDFLKVLDDCRTKDIERRNTSHGPHRDDFKILIANKDAKIYASEGQQRSAVIALKLAQFEAIKIAKNITPTILCDDILGELDTIRREAFWSCIDTQSQVIATSTEQAPAINNRGTWKTLLVNNGTFSEQ